MAALGHLVELSVQVHKGDDEKNINIFIWTPDDILPKDEEVCGTGTYYDVLDSCRWDDWSPQFDDFLPEGWEETGLYEPNRDWEHVPFDDPRIQLAYTDPLAKPHKYEIRKAPEKPPTFLEKRRDFHLQYIEPGYEGVSGVFAGRNRAFFDELSLKVWDHLQEMIKQCGGDPENPKDMHMVSARHTKLLQALDTVKDETAKTALAWSYNPRKRRHD